MIPARLQRLLISALLALAVIAAYAPLARYDFIALDDAEYVRSNPNINSGFSWSGFKWILENSVGGNWHPVTMLSHMTDCQIYGLNAGGHHFTNVLFHVVNTVLLFWLLLAMTGGRTPKPDHGTIPEARRKLSKNSPLSQRSHSTALPGPPSVVSNLWPCALVAALFGLHPQHVESVAWIAERKDVLSGFFFMLTLWSYARFTKESKHQSPKAKVFYAVTLLLFSLGLMSKPMLVTLPFVLFLLDFWPLERFQTKGLKSQILPLVLEKLPFLALAAIISVITFLIQKKHGAVVALDTFPFHARLDNAMVCYADYLAKLFWPHPLAMLYPYRRWTDGQITFSTLLFLGLSFAAILNARRRPYLFVGWFWFAGMMVPVIGLVQVGIQVMADRYIYLPSIGIFIALAWGLADLVTRTSRPPVPGSRQNRGTPVLPRALAASAAALAVVILAALTAVQVRYWKNTETLFEHAVRVTGDNTEAHYILGALFESQGETTRARSEFEQSVRDNPDNIKALGGLGYILCCEGKFDEAADAYRAALRVEPDSAKAHFGLAEVLRKQHDYDDAIREYFLALKSDPNLPEAHYQLANLYSTEHDDASAILHLRKTVELAPDWFLPLNNLAWMLATEPDPKLRNGTEATRLAMHAAAVVGINNPNALDTLAAAYAESGRFKDAVATAHSAIQDASAGAQTNLVAEISSRLKLYEAHQAYRE